MGAYSFLTVLALAATAVAVPLTNSGSCARQCTESAKFKYTPGTSYFFDYESDAVTTMQGASKEESRLHLRSKVEIHAISKCDFVMRLSGVSLEHSEPENPRSRRPVASLDQFRQSLERYTLRFSFQDGNVETICPADGDSVQALNVKRGILSALQTSAGSLESSERVVETDVAGKCMVNYEPLGRGWNTVTVRKIKDLSTCTERHNVETAIQMNPFMDSKEIKSTPLIKGTQECQQVFKHDRLESVMCSETHVFRPFSRQEGGAMTKVTQALTFNNEKKTAFTGAEFPSYLKAMTYDHQVDVKENERRTRQVEMTLVDLCMAAKDDIRPSVPGKFTTFVYGLRQLEQTDLENMFRRVERICPDNSKAKKIYLDGVTMAGTSGAIKFIVDLMKRGEMPEKEIDLWINTLAFVNKPDKEALVAILPLLDGNRMDVILPVSAVVHTFCRQNEECGLKNEVRQVVQKLARLLGNNCNSDKTKVMLTLKALGNIGVAFDTEEKLQACAQNSDLDTEVRVAAIQAYRRLGCDVMRSPIVELYLNQEENVEVRIAAFLNGMRCPSEAMLMKVKNAMEEEKIKQVGSFVLSYLKNIEGKIAYKNEVHEIVSNVDLLNKFESDIRKYSRNYQTSMFMETMDSGFALESNVVFDTTSYLPRTAMLNLTVDIMGRNINLLELEGRAEGFEKIVERMFGPEGYFRKDNTVRSKRSISDNKIEKMDKVYDVKKNFEKDPSLSLDMKIFGNSLWYKKFQEGNMVSNAFGAMDILVELAKEQDIELTKSFLFLDTVVQLPTGNGLPLRLAINGSVVVNLKMNGKVDVRSMDNVDVHGKIQPSGAVEIATLMSVDAGVARTGLKMVATLHSSTLLDGLVEVRGGKVYKARLNMPRDQLEFIDVQSRIFLVNAHEEREQKSMVEQNSLYTECLSKTSVPLGVELCSELQLPSGGKKNAPLYPFSGPAKFRIFLRKTDPTLTSYDTEINWTEEKSGREVIGQQLKVSFNTPGSKTDRGCSVEYRLNKQDMTAAFKLQVPGKKIALIGKGMMKDEEKRINVALSVDDKEKFSVSTSLLTEETDGGIRYQPALEIRGPSSRLVNIRSTATIKSPKYIGEIIIEDLTATPIVMNGEMTIGERNRYEIMAMTESYALSSKVKGHIQFRNGFASRLNCQYRIMEGRKETLDINSKVRDLSANGLIKYSGATSLTSSAIPEISTTLSWEAQFTAGHMEKSFDLSFGDGRIRRIHKISMSKILKYQGTLDNNSVDYTVRLTYPEKDIDFAMQMNHKNTLKSLQNTINLKYAPGKEASSSVDLNLNLSPLKLNSDIQLKYPGREMRLQGDVNQKQKEYDATVMAQWQRGKQIRAVGNLRDSSTRVGRDYMATMEMSIPNSRPVSFASQLTTMPGRYLISADTEFGRGKYGLKGEYNRASVWNHRASAIVKIPNMAYTAEGAFEKNGEVVTGKMDLNVPEYRRVTGTVQMSNGAKVKAGAADIMWDADRDQSKRVQMDAEFRLLADGNQGKFSLKSPIKTMSGSYNANYVGQYRSGSLRGGFHTELEWEDSQKITMDVGCNINLKKTRDQISGDVKITTPVRGYENMVLTVQHSDTWPEWNNKLMVQWMRNRKITLGTEGKIHMDSSSSLVDARIKMNTPFRGYESMSMRQIYEKRPSEVSTSTTVQYATGKVIDLSLSGALVGHNVFKAGANLTTPFYTVRDVSVTLSNTISSNNINTEFDARWNTQNSMNFNFDGRSLVTGKKHTCSADVQFTSTIRNYEKLMGKVVYNKDARSASLSSDLRVNNNRMTVGLNGENRNSYYGLDMEGKMEYSSNFRNFEKGQIKMAHSSDSQKFLMNIESNLPYSNKLNLKLLGNMPSYGEMDSSLTLASTFMDDVTYQVAYKVDKQRMAANGVGTYGDQKVSGDAIGTFQYRGSTWDLDYKVNINTPVRGLEELKFGLTQTKKQLHFTTRMHATKNQDTITLNQDLQIEDALNFNNNLRVTTPFRSLRSMEINTRQNGKAGEYKHATDAQWGSKKASLSMELNNQDQRRGHNFEARLNAKSPFQTIRNLDIEVRHDDDERSYKPRFSIQWNENKISADGVLNNNRFKKVDASLSASTSFPGYETMMITGKYDVTNRQKTAEMSYRWSERSNKAVTVRGTLEADSKTGMVELIATTPVRGYETVQVKTDYALNDMDNSLNLLTQYGEMRYSFNGKHVRRPNGNEINAQVSTPISGYERLSASGSYAINKRDMSTEASYEWGNDKKVAANAEYKYQNGKVVGRLNVNTPFNGYKDMALKIEGNTQSPKKTGAVMIQMDPSRIIQLNGAIETDMRRFGNVNMEFRSPFDGMKELSMNGEIKRIPDEFSAEATMQWLPSKKITGNLLLKPNQIVVTFDTPFRPYKNVKFASQLNNRENEAYASLEWENTNKADISANYRMSDKSVEGKVEVNIPLNGKKTYSVTGNLMNDNFKMMEGRIDLKTPEDRYQVSSLIRNNNENREMSLSLEGPKSKMSLNGNFVNKRYRDIDGNLKVDSNINYIPSFSVKGSYKNDDWKNIRVNAGLNNVHTVSGSFKDDDKAYQIEATVESPRLSSKRATVSANINARDIRSMDGSITVEASQRHVLTVSEKYSSRGFEGELKAISPLIHGNDAQMNVFYSNKMNKDIQGKISILENRRRHGAELSYSSENRDMTASLKLECDVLLKGKVNLIGKLSRPTDNTIETIIKAQTDVATHTLQANGKLLDNQVELKVNMDSPLVSNRPVSLTANLNNENYRNIDGSISVKGFESESRVALNMRRNEWRELDAFFTMNLPIESLSMLRVDMKMKNEGLRSMEGSVDIKSSLKAMQSMSLSGKMKNTDNAWDMSMNCKLPVRNLDNIALLVTVHKHSDWSRVSPRVTLSIPNRKYVANANYEKTENDFKASLGCELDSNMYDLSFEKHPNEYSLVLSTPIRGHQRYSGVLKFRNEKGKNNAQLVLEDAQNRMYTADVNYNFQNFMNFLGEAKLLLPYEGLRDISTVLKQSYRRGRWAATFEHNMGRSKKLALNIQHNGNPVTGTIQIVTPVEEMKNVKLNYNWLSSSNTNGKMEVELNNNNVFRVNVDSTYQSDTRTYTKKVQIELPTYPYTLTVSSNPLAGGSELVVKSVTPSRSLKFQTMYQSSPNLFTHGSHITLDERTGQTISYEIRSAPTSRQGSEFYAILTMPIRVLSLRTTHEKTSTGRTATADFMWDANRDQTRHMKLTFEHVDQSTRYNLAHKLRLTAAHPQLSKDIVLATECLMSPNELYGKTEVEYSRYQQHNIFLEARVKNAAQSRRDSRYVATITARHPVTNLDMKVTAEVANTRDEMAAEMQVNYLDRNLKQQIQELRTKIQKVKQELEIMARSNENQINLLGRMFHKDNELTLALEQSMNNEAPVHSHFRWSRLHKNMELNISSPYGDRLRVKALMPEDHIQAEISHTVSGQQYKDGVVFFGLKDSKILESRINWRPEAYSEAQEGLSRMYEKNIPKLMNAVSSLRYEMFDELNSKSDKLVGAIAQETKPFVNEISREMKKLKIDGDRASSELYRMYRNDEFYMRSAEKYVDSVIVYTLQRYEAFVNELMAQWEEISESFSFTMEIAMNIYEGMIEDIERMVRNYNKWIRLAVARWSKYASQMKKEYMDMVIEGSVKLVERMGQMVGSVVRSSKNFISRYAPAAERYWKKTVAAVKDVAEWIQESLDEPLKSLRDYPGYKALREYVTRVVETVSEFQTQLTYDEMLKETRMFLSNGMENLATAYQYVRDHPNINYMNNLASSAFDQGRNVAVQLGVNSMMVNILEDLYQKTQQLTWNTLREVAEEYADIRSNAEMIYEPENGKIVVEIRLPVMTKSLKQLLDVNSYPQINKLKELGSQISFGDFCVWDTYYKYKRYMDIKYWLPPFSAQAMIVGSQHYLTFDNVDFDFAGDCSYLLARDFVDGNFTVTVNYAREDTRVVKKSLNVYTDGVKIEIIRDNKVTIDDRKVELPQEIGKTSLKMEDGIITVSNRLGYEVKCNFVHDLCTLEVSGFYFGKTGGLFGTNNYEPAHDMRTPEKKIAGSLEEFSQSWQVGSAQCSRSKNLAEVTSVDQRAKEKCEQLFKNYNSEFRSGFKQVNPEPFLRMCITDLSPLREAEQKMRICTSAAAYVERCRQEGVNLNMPKQCVRCERLNADHMESGDVVKITQDEPVRAADIVFIVEEKECNRNVPAVLSKLAQSIEDGFRKAGYRQVHFAVVGFGGDGIHSEPHVMTADSQVFATVRNIDSALNSLTIGNGDSNIFMALRYAAGLPYMTGSTKTFILAKCSACRVEEMKADYSEMLRTMLDSDITLHLLMEHEIETRSPNKPEQAKKVLGMDRKYAYTTKDMKTNDIRGDRDLLAQLKPPKDLCVPLALEVDGSFFSMSRMQDKKNVNKKTVEVMSKRIMKSAKPAECQICECIATQSGIGKSICQRCVSPVVARIVSGDYSPMINYGSDDTENDIV